MGRIRPQDKASLFVAGRVCCQHTDISAVTETDMDHHFRSGPLLFLLQICTGGGPLPWIDWTDHCYYDFPEFYRFHWDVSGYKSLLKTSWPPEIWNNLLGCSLLMSKPVLITVLLMCLWYFSKLASFFFFIFLFYMRPVDTLHNTPFISSHLHWGLMEIYYLFEPVFHMSGGDRVWWDWLDWIHTILFSVGTRSCTFLFVCYTDYPNR